MGYNLESPHHDLILETSRDSTWLRKTPKNKNLHLQNTQINIIYDTLNGLLTGIEEAKSH